MSILVSSVVLALSTTVGTGCAAPASQAAEVRSPAADSSQSKVVSIEDLVAKPEVYVEQPIRVRGKLRNAGTNYFTDRRIVLTDAKGRILDVKPWLPLSRPAPSGRTQSGPTLAEYLDHEVEIEGSLVRRSEPDRGNDYILDVKSARVLDI